MAAALSPEQDSIARKSLTPFLNAVESVGQKAIAEACGVDDSTISGDKARWARFCQQLAFTGFKVVPMDVQCRAPREWDSICYFAEIGFAAVLRGDAPPPARKVDWSA